MGEQIRAVDGLAERAEHGANIPATGAAITQSTATCNEEIDVAREPRFPVDDRRNSTRDHVRRAQPVERRDDIRRATVWTQAHTAPPSFASSA